MIFLAEDLCDDTVVSQTTAPAVTWCDVLFVTSPVVFVLTAALIAGLAGTP